MPNEDEMTIKERRKYLKRMKPLYIKAKKAAGKMYVNGWIKSVTLHSALAKEAMLRLCG